VAPSRPLDLQQDILDLIESKTGNIGSLEIADNRREFVESLIDHLNSGDFAYTLAPPPVPTDAEPIGEFLFESKRGHCEYFASALAVMCQLKGVPARVISGYLDGDYNSMGHFYVVRDKHAHSWVEVFIPGEDWVRFDPTPVAAGRNAESNYWAMQVRRYLDYFQFYWAAVVVDYDTNVRQDIFEAFNAWLRRPARDQRTIIGGVWAFIRELFGWRLQLNWRERLIYWAFSLLVIMLTVLMGYVIWTVMRWLATRIVHAATRAAAEARNPEAEFYHRFCRRLSALGLRRRPDQTPAEFADELAALWPTFREAPRLVQAYYRVTFGQQPIGPVTRTRIETFLRRLREIDPVEFHRRQQTDASADAQET
jgi:hypothetical protein